MARGEDWSEREVRATVRSYLDMFELELNDQPLNKTDHRRILLPKLEGRTEGSIERKHMNISAALNRLGFPGIDGYKPLGNLQGMLMEVVQEELDARPALAEKVGRVVEAPPSVAVPSVDAILSALVERPQARGRMPGVPAWPDSVAETPTPLWRARRVDYLEREARNQALGFAGEEFALRFEQARLVAAGKERLAAQVEHVSRTRGDGLGFDILSFDPGGEERFVEVKTTNFGPDTPFFATRSEVAFSQREAAGYRLSRVFAFRKPPRLFTLPGSLMASCRLEPETYRGQVAG